MSRQYINGYMYPVFNIYTASGTFLEAVTLDLCGTEGLKEYYNFEMILNKQDNLEEYTKVKGIKLEFELNYNEYANATLMSNIEKIIDAILNNHKIYIYPRADYLWRVYEVIYTGDIIELGILKGGEYARGMKGVVLKFRTKNKITKLNWINPNNILYSGRTTPVFKGQLIT